MNTRKLIISDYNPQWKINFEELKSIFTQQLGKDMFINIEHVGSTSILGLKAKPILDIDIIVENDNVIVENVISKIKKLGYKHLGDYGIPGREAFSRENENIPFTGNNKTWQTHNLYVCKEGNPNLLNHLLFRDYLREHPKALKEYGELKETLVAENNTDREQYCKLKTTFICNILEQAGLPKVEVEEIRRLNEQ